MINALEFMDNCPHQDEKRNAYMEGNAEPKRQNSFCQQPYTVSSESQMSNLFQHMCQQNMQTMQGITTVNQALGENVLGATNEMLKTVRSLQRENARKKNGKVFTIDEEGFIEISQYYDDGFKKDLGLLSNELYYPIDVYRLIVPKELKNTMEILEIRSGDEAYICRVPLKKGWGKDVYHAMICVGISFNPLFKEAEICGFLERMLAPKIDQAECIMVNHLSGWNCKEGRFVQGPVWQNWEVNCPLPRDEKILAGRLSADSLAEYMRYFLAVKNVKMKIMLWLYPFLGLSNALLEKNGLSFQGILNLVVPDSARIQNAVAFFLQTYFRNKTGNLSVTDKLIEKCLGEARDEVLVLQSSDQGSAYFKEKQKQILNRIMLLSHKELELPSPYNRELLGIICLLSRQPVDGAKVIHLYADDDFPLKVPKLGTQDRDVMQDVWCGYIEWVQRNWDRVQILIGASANKCGNDEAEAVFEAVYCLVEEYFKTLGIDSFSKEIGLLSKPDFQMFFVEDSDSETVHYFVTEMRKLIQGYFLQDLSISRSYPAVNDTILFDSSSLLIEAKLFDSLLEMMQINSKQKLLLKLLEAGMLVANTDRFYYYLQLSGKRFRTVKLRLELFEKIGEVSIVELGKEK